MKDCPTFETIYPKVRRKWQRWRWVSEPKTSAKDEQIKLIRRLLFTGRMAFDLGGPDGGRLGHRLQLEAARLALELAVPGVTDLEHQPLTHLQWALSDLDQSGRRGKCFDPHYRMTGSGTRPTSHEQLVFKSVCIVCARLLVECGYTRFKADTTVNNRVLEAGKRLGLRMKKAVTNAGDEPRGRRLHTTLEGWRKDHTKRVKQCLSGRRVLHVSLDLDGLVWDGMNNEDKRKLVDRLIAHLQARS
jgi:hypothetical protein